jgi:hypothetical protein
MRSGAGFIIGTFIGITATIAQADPLVRGNDTSGIISWSCENEAIAPDLAAAHCARYNKYPRFTSVHRRYGDYIAFQCLWSPHIARYQIPAMRVGALCPFPVPEFRAVVKALN